MRKNRISLEEVEERLSVKGISIVDYVNINKKSKFKCSQGHVFIARANDIFKSKRNGCQECAGLKKLTKDEINIRLFNTGIILVEEPNNSKHKVSFRCNKGHLFKATTNHVLRGSSCPDCSSFSFSQNKPATLYYIKIDDKVYKIGCTGYDIGYRFWIGKNRIKVIKTWLYDKGIDAMEEEQRIKHKFSEYKYTGKPILRDGNTEMFTKDVLNLDL